MFIIVLLLVIYLFFIMPRMFNKPDTSVLRGYHYAHRGLFNNDGDAPENSLLAFKRAVEKGYGIELDVQLTKDDQLIVFHDASLKRMTGIDGYVWDYTLEELKQFKLGDSQETIPTFQEVLDVIDGKVPFILEYKLDRPQTKVCVLANELLKDYRGVYCIESFHPLAPMWYKKNRPDVIRGQLSCDYWKENRRTFVLTLLMFLLSNIITRPDFIAYKHTDMNISVRLNKLLGAFMVTWTVKSKEDYNKVKDFYDVVIFDSFEL